MKPKKPKKPSYVVPETLPDQLRECWLEQRTLTRYRKFRIRTVNNLRSLVANDMGYHTGLPQKDRNRILDAVDKRIGAVDPAAPDLAADPMAGHIASSLTLARGAMAVEDGAAKHLEKLAAHLPVSGWMDSAEQRGFGLLSLAQMIGEAGDLRNFRDTPKPNGHTGHGYEKLWSFLGLAPFTKGGKTQMGSTWKSGRGGTLTAKEWTAFGYSPRRRSLIWVIGDSLLKQNYLRGEKHVGDLTAALGEVSAAILSPRSDHGPADGSTGEPGGALGDVLRTLPSAGPDSSGEEGDLMCATGDSCAALLPGPYLACCLAAKRAAFAKHPDWPWNPCKGKKDKGCPGAGCFRCGGHGHVCMYAHLHGSLLAAKLLVANLWREWHRVLPPLPAA